MLFKLAIRNIKRNKRQTLITIGAILIAVFLSCFLRSFQKGGWDNIVANSINLYYGHIQIHHEGFEDEKTIDNSFEVSDEFFKQVGAIPNVKVAVPRLESFALASTGNTTKGVVVMGIQPKTEDAFTEVSKRVIEGQYLNESSQGVLIAEGLADRLNLNVNDTLVLLSQGFHGVNAAGKYMVEGIVKYPLPDLNKSLVFLPLSIAQSFYGAENRLTSLALQLSGERKVPAVKQFLETILKKDKYEVLDYKELMPDLLQARQLDELGAYLIMFILYCLIGFTMMGSVLMMTKKRSYEFGVLLSVGMQRWQLFITVFFEIIIQAIIGVALGIIFILPIATYFHNNPINMNMIAEDAAKAFEAFGFDPVFAFSLSPSIFINQSIVIFTISLLLSIYPFISIFKLKPVQAMRG